MGVLPAPKLLTSVVASPALRRLGLLGSLGGTSVFFAASGPPQRVRCRWSGAPGRVQIPAGAAACAGGQALGRASAESGNGAGAGLD